MSKKNYLLSMMTTMMVAMLSVGFVSCGDDEEDNITQNPPKIENNNSNEETKDYTATTAVKTVTLKNGYFSGTSIYDPTSITITNDIIIYTDFNYQYSLLMSGGKIHLCVYHRENGSWRAYHDSYNLSITLVNGQSGWHLTEIEDIGKVSSINDIVYKTTPPRYLDINNHGKPQVIQPNHGYAMAFITEEKVILYLRVYIQGYTLDTDGSLKEITIQYQLY